MSKIVLISCSKSKRTYKCKAREMYDKSDLFRKSWEYATLQKPDRIYILSAKYFLLDPEQVIEPYKVTLSYVSKKERLKNPDLKILNKEERKNWYTQIINQLNQVSDIKKDYFIILAGKRYIEGFIDQILNKECPLDGNFCERKAWLKKKISELRNPNEQKL